MIFECTPSPPIRFHPSFWIYEMCSDEKYVMQVSFTSDFPSFYVSKVFFPAESTILGFFLLVLQRWHPSLLLNSFEIFNNDAMKDYASDIWFFYCIKVFYFIASIFYFIMKKWWKFSQKTYFLAIFNRFFSYALLLPLCYAPRFGQIKCFMKIQNRCKFHQSRICGCQVTYFQRFSYLQKVGFFAASG